MDQEKTLKAVIEAESKLNGAGAKSHTYAMMTLSHCYTCMGRLAEAEDVATDVLAIIDRDPLPDRIFRIRVLNFLAQRYCDEKKFKQAEPLVRRAIEESKVHDLGDSQEYAESSKLLEMMLIPSKKG